MFSRAVPAAGVVVGAALLIGACGQQEVATQATAATSAFTVAPTTAPSAVQATATAGATCKTVAPLPTWLPADVNGQGFRCLDPSAGAPLARGPAGADTAADGDAGSRVVPTQPSRTVRIVTYRLRGSKNADTISGHSLSAADVNDPRQHFRADIVIVTYPGSRQLADPLPADDSFTVTQVALTSGAVARLSANTNGLGATRLEWVIGGNSYLLLSSRFATDQGPSGVPTADLLRMAGSVA